MIAFALANWRWFVLVAGLVAAGLLIRSYGNQRCDECRAAVIAQYEKQLAAANERTRLAEIQSRQRAEQVDREYQKSLQDLDAKYRDAVARIGPVRVRQCPRNREVPRIADPATVDHGGAAGNGFSEAPGERDIGPDLIELARLADKQTHQLVACQAYVRSLDGLASR